MKKFLSSLLIVFVTIFVAPAYADDACKNLFNADRMFAGRGAYYEKNADGTWKQKQNDMKAWAEIWENYTTLQPGTYTISTTGANVRFACKIVSDPSRDFMSQTPIMTFTLDQQENFVCKMFAIDGTYPNEIGNIQLERGSTATSYVPYNPLCATCQGIVKTYESATGTVSQNGTPTPTNPVEPTFYQQGDMILRKVGDYADSYDATTGKITRRVGVKVLDGTESWQVAANVYIKSDATAAFIPIVGMIQTITADFLCTQLKPDLHEIWQQVGYPNTAQIRTNVDGAQFMVNFGNDIIGITDYTQETRSSAETKIKNYIAQQYAAGTPVTVWYPLATPVEETPASTTYCADTIKIATTAYNAARFSPVVTDLNSAVATIREIVTKTINQTAAIASLQADKQTRPEEQCPAGKKCLLVETEENGVVVPHWFPIIEAPE